MESKSRKMSTLIFMFAIFVLLAAFLGSWLYRIYKEQTTYSQEQTLAAVDCGRFYYQVDSESVSYKDGVLFFLIENTIGKEITSLTLETALETKHFNMTGLTPGAMVPVNQSIRMTTWVWVYPTSCRGINFKNISFQPNI
ncbi:TPA: hypothetical protein HA265_05755 [Candidatus Woesearchaeota archaeon]|nr:hypothetical protein [Candidatus Woesearchaeota archaeon]